MVLAMSRGARGGPRASPWAINIRRFAAQE